MRKNINRIATIAMASLVITSGIFIGQPATAVTTPIDQPSSRRPVFTNPRACANGNVVVIVDHSAFMGGVNIEVGFLGDDGARTMSAPLWGDRPAGTIVHHSNSRSGRGIIHLNGPVYIRNVRLDCWA